MSFPNSSLWHDLWQYRVGQEYNQRKRLGHLVRTPNRERSNTAFLYGVDSGTEETMEVDIYGNNSPSR